MSLVNDMLKDLDARRANESKKVDLRGLVGRVSRKPMKRVLPAISIFFILLLLMVGFAIWKNMSTATLATVDRFLNRESAPVPTADSIPVAVIESESEAIVDKALVEMELATEAGSAAVLTEQNKADSVDEGDSLIAATELVRSAVVVESADRPKNVASEGGSQSSIPVPSTRAAVEAVEVVRPLSEQQVDRNTARRARQLLRSNQHTEAQSLLSNFIDLQPIAPYSGELLASLWLSQKDFVRVEPLLKSLYSAYSQNIAIRVLYARLLLLTDRSSLAVQLLSAQQPSVAAYNDYYELFALAARKNEQYQLSAQTYRRLLSVDSGQGDWWVGLAIALDAQALQSPARTAFMRALDSGRIGAALADYARQRLSAISNISEEVN